MSMILKLKKRNQNGEISYIVVEKVLIQREEEVSSGLDSDSSQDSGFGSSFQEIPEANRS